MKLTGRVAYRDLEGGVWVLEGDDGRTYQLDGGDRHLKQDGKRVRADGDLKNQQLSIQMAGPIFRVKSYQILD